MEIIILKPIRHFLFIFTWDLIKHFSCESMPTFYSLLPTTLICMWRTKWEILVWAVVVFFHWKIYTERGKICKEFLDVNFSI